MNILQHIIAGHYPLDDKGRALVPTRKGLIAVIYATDMPAGRYKIAGCLQDRGLTSWTCDGQYHEGGGGFSTLDLLPPAPRKVEMKRYLQLSHTDPGFSYTYVDPLTPSRDYPKFVVELTGSYEIPWGDE